MNREYPILSLSEPQREKRRKEKPLFPLLPAEKLNNRQQISQTLIPQASSLSSELQAMSDEQRKAVIIKLQHELPVPLEGTDLKPIAISESFTLAAPKTENLKKLEKKIKDFGTGDLKKGHAPNERLAYLEAIQKAEPKDRLSQELFEKYEELIVEPWVTCEVEILSLEKGKNQQRDELRQIRTDLQRIFSGRLYLFEHEEIKGTCRAVIRCQGEVFKHLVEGQEWQRKIVWFDARPKFETLQTILQDFDVDLLGEFTSPNPNAPIVCIVDSGVTYGNPFLKPVVREDLLRSFLRGAPDEPEDQYGHGSGVASLAAYYALNLYSGADHNGHVWIASARVLDENNQLEDLGNSPEAVPRLFSKVLTEVVETFVPLGVRIFNLSIGITNQKWNASSKRTVPRRSWVARTIDRLCREHDVIFVISSGNIEPIPVREFYEKDEPYPKYFLSEESSILDPGQSALALTVGSLAATTIASGLAAGGVASAMAIAEKNYPSPFTRTGPGINREIKPDLVDLGGNYLIDPGGQVRTNIGTNVYMASHQLTPAVSHDSGTSFATPRITHKIARILEALQALNIEPSAPLLKAFAVNSASYDFLSDELDLFSESLDTSKNKSWLNVLGYGMPDYSRATSCNPHSAILWFQGEIFPDTVMFFDIPVPACLVDSGRATKRLTITIVYAPKVQRWGLERYLGTTLKWKVFRGNVSRDEIINTMSVEDEDEAIIEENSAFIEGSDDEEETTTDKPQELKKFKLGINRRSRGTVQHDIYEWSLHKEEYSTNCYTLAVAAYGKWNKQEADPLAVVVRIEDTTSTVPVYLEVRNILEVEVET